MNSKNLARDTHMAEEEKMAKLEAAAQNAEAKAACCESAPPEPVSDDDKLWGMLANLLGVIPLVGPIAALVIKGNSKFVKFNALQMIFATIAMIPVGLVLGLVGIVVSMVPILGPLAWHLASSLFGVIGLILIMYLGTKANSGVLFKVPFIGEIAFKSAYGATGAAK